MKSLLPLFLLFFLVPNSFAGKRKFSDRHLEEIQKVLAQIVFDELAIGAPRTVLQRII